MIVYAIGDLHLPGGDDKPMAVLARIGKAIGRKSVRIGARA